MHSRPIKLSTTTTETCARWPKEHREIDGSTRLRTDPDNDVQCAFVSRLWHCSATVVRRRYDIVGSWNDDRRGEHSSSNDVVEYDKSLSSPIIFSVCVCVCVCSAHNWHAGCSNMFARPCRMPLGICVSRLNMKWRHCHCQGLFGVRCLLKGLRFGHIHHIQISTLPHTALHSALHTTKCSRVNLTQALAQCICRLICAFTVHPTDNSFNYCHSPSRKRAPCSGCGEKTWTATKTKKWSSKFAFECLVLRADRDRHSEYTYIQQHHSLFITICDVCAQLHAM